MTQEKKVESAVQAAPVGNKSQASKTAAVTKPATTPKPVAKPTASKTTPPAKPATTPAKGVPASNQANCKHDAKKDSTKVAPEVPEVSPTAQTVQIQEAVKPGSAKDAKDDPPKMNKKISASRLLLARVYVRLENIEDAKKYYNQVIEAEPNVSEIF